MDKNRDAQEVILAIQKAAFLMDPFFKLTMVGAALLLTYCARMVKEGKISKGEFKNVQEFMKATEGRYTIVNLPYEKNYSPWEVHAVTEEGKEFYIIRNKDTGDILQGKNKEEQTWGSKNKAEKVAGQMNAKENLALEELKSSGIRHVVMPDLNPEDGMVQIAVFDDDKEKFSGWMERYLIQRMQGGEKSYRDLTNLTSGRTTVISIPLEGDEGKKIFEEDFQKLKINYAILPDLNVGDGEIQLLVANADMSKIELWFNLYREEQLRDGNEIGNLKSMSMQEYTNTGNLTEEQYVDTAGEEFRKANEKYETKSPGELEQVVIRQENRIKSRDHEIFDKYEHNPAYQKISVNRKTLVDQSVYARSQPFLDKGLFASRIPGTYGEAEKILLVPASQVFEVDQGENYILFLKKDQVQMVKDIKGKNPENIQELTGENLYRMYYDPVNRKVDEMKSFEKKNDVKKTKQTTKKRFNNIEKRNYDYDGLEKALLESEIPGGYDKENKPVKIPDRIPKNPIKVK